jgi:hypothetical protein
MAVHKRPTTGKKRGPSRRRFGDEKPKGRSPQAETLTLEKFRASLTETIDARPSLSEITLGTTALRRTAVEEGDLLALYTALHRCLHPLGIGALCENGRPGAPDKSIRFVPDWLLAKTLRLLWHGLQGTWPQGRGRHAVAATRWRDARYDLWRTWHVLKAREDGVALEEAFELVARKSDLTDSAESVKDSYLRVRRNLRRDPDYYRRMGPFLPPIHEAVPPPERDEQ